MTDKVKVANQKFVKLKELLMELFQLDQPELDFGFYRVMHARAKEVTQFLEKDLLPPVAEVFEQYQSADAAGLQEELEQAISQAKALGADPDTLPKVKELKGKLSTTAVDISRLESEVYDHLFTFFRRYYHEGDFLSKRVYKDGVYAIPYSGEEVKLHWANADQYYIKTDEYLKDYSFRMNPSDDKNPMRVHFRISAAQEGEHGNVKTADNAERKFILAASDFIFEEDGDQGKELILSFEYRPSQMNDWSEELRQGKKTPPAQKDLLQKAVKSVLEVTDSTFSKWIKLLSSVAPSPQNSSRTNLEKHLDRYTKRNTFDYFIHKDLGGFLRQELDFYVKNEVMHLDDIENENVPKVEQYLSKIKAIRKIAGKLIEFLAQLEDFQKKLWLKKKFIVETNYCITLDRVAEEFYAEILANEEQRKEWIKLFSIDEIKGDLVTPAYSVPLSDKFLSANKNLVLDTRFFSLDFKSRLIASFEALTEQLDGILIHAENRQALSLLQKRYGGEIDCIHIDPPYNTATSGFLYKNEYQHSSWLSMMSQTIEQAKTLLSADGAFQCHIDENEVEVLQLAFERCGIPNCGTIIWDKKNPMLGRRGIATQHEYILWRSHSTEPFYLRGKNVEAILAKANELIKQHGGINARSREEYSRWLTSQVEFSGGEKAYRFIDDAGKVFRGVAMGAPEPRQDPKFHIPLIHPITKKPCPVPPNGWSRTPETLRGLIERGDLLFGNDETVQPQKKVLLTADSRRQISSVIQDAKSGKAYLDELGLAFPYSHPVSLYDELLGAIEYSPNVTYLDYFAGSGTAGHAVINLNRADNGRRKYLLVEMGAQFDSAIIPRLSKVIYSDSWRSGKPQSRSAGISQMFKVIRLESYEDALNNLEQSQGRLAQLPLERLSDKVDSFKEQYLLKYLLNIDARGSQSLLNIKAFVDPTAYGMKIKYLGSDENKDVAVDLLETFNWLLGLTVDHVAAPRTFNTTFKRDSEGRLGVASQLKQSTDGKDAPWWFRTVSGKDPEGRRVLVIWRKRPGGDTAEGIEQDNLVLNEWFRKLGFSTKDSEFDVIYVNGSSNLENVRTADERWKVRLIEEDFMRLMFDVEEV